MTGPTPFHDLDDYLDLGRLSGLTLSPDGTSLVVAVAKRSQDRTKHVSALWALDTTDATPPRRLTRSSEGESSAAFLPDGTLLFTSRRPVPDPPKDEPDDDVAALWALPPAGGEASVVARRPGGVSGPVTARSADVVVVTTAAMPGTTTAAEDAERRKARKDAAVTAILHEGYPVRAWDHDLGPDQVRLLVGRGLAERSAGDDEPAALEDLTPTPGRRLDDAGVDLAPDGTFALAAVQVPDRDGTRTRIDRIDATTGEATTLLADPAGAYHSPVIDPSGTRAVVAHSRDSTPTRAPDTSLEVVDLATGDVTRLAPAWDRWPGGVVWLPDGDAVLCHADDGGAGPVFRIDVADGTVTRLTTDHGAYTDLAVHPDGDRAFALRSAVDSPPTPVRIDTTTPGAPQPLTSPAPPPALPGVLDEVTATAADGTALRAWLAVPADHDEHAAPLLLWIHGGPLNSWNAWSWRWNPWLAVARGYAVLLPDPALSTGYGLDFIERGWGAWGDAPYTDLLAVTDAACGRGDIDETRTAAMGGSFGGYMANWVAGHTDRFDAIVTHASLWALDQFGPTTDRSDYWRRELTEEMALANSPHRFVADISTPMLVVHGDKDYRVPIGEGLRLWHELARHHAAADGAMPHKFLYFPDENHWILKPNHARLWYETVFAFLAHHVLGQDWEPPALLT